MSFGQDFLKGFAGTDSLRDFTHASKTFRTNGYELAPRFKYLFHVSFTVNIAHIPQLGGPTGAFTNTDLSNLGLVVKNVQLPSYEMAVNELNQYNRKRLVQTKINYQPVQFTFHDDGSDLIRNLWYNYFSYYYKDPSQTYSGGGSTQGTNGNAQNTTTGFDYNGRDIYDQYRLGNDWGYIGENYADPNSNLSDVSTSGKPPFFRDIRIYGLNQHKFVSYVMINPIITQWQHDQFDYSQSNGTMEHKMTIKYETVKYYSGAIGSGAYTPFDPRVDSDTNVKGFADPSRYDTVRSPISRPGSTATVLGQGGLLDTGIGIINDLQRGDMAGILGAVQKGATSYQTFKGANLKSIVNEEAKTAFKDVAKQELPGQTRAVINKGNSVFFPTPPRGR
jgi:hypothetical protein